MYEYSWFQRGDITSPNGALEGLTSSGTKLSKSHYTASTHRLNTYIHTFWQESQIVFLAILSKMANPDNTQRALVLKNK